MKHLTARINLTFTQSLTAVTHITHNSHQQSLDPLTSLREVQTRNNFLLVIRALKIHGDKIATGRTLTTRRSHNNHPRPETLP